MKNKLKSYYFKIFLIPILFLLVSLFTLSDYGISWDEPIHFQRGQTYLHYFMTGKLTYDDLPLIQEHVAKIEGFDLTKDYATRKIKSLANGYRRSYYQNDSINGQWFLKNDGGHPPLNGILAAFTNWLFYQKLGIMGDIESHHLFIVLTSAFLVLVVSFFAYEVLGTFPAMVAGLTLSTYPLFFAESHFNIKDPPLAAFYGATIWLFWLSLERKSARLFFGSLLTFSLALGTKFNILFLPAILIPYLIFRFGRIIVQNNLNPFKILKIIPLSYRIAILLAPIVVIAIFVGTWPFLWQDVFGNIYKIFKYYKSIGTGATSQTRFILPGGFNLYPIYWIFITTPLHILALSLIGFITAIKYWKEKRSVYLLWVLWFIIPILRISFPKTVVYGGIRQIMEFIPAMALLAGLGAWELKKLFPKFTSFIIMALFISHLVVLVKLHPNENVYFNRLIGGLPGAKAHDIPSWGNSFGNAYRQAVSWINENAEINARLALVQGTFQNIPVVDLRPDIRFWNGYWSGIERRGEYLVELTHQDTVRVYHYAWDYVDRFLSPVYEVKVDGVSIAKVWKNDLEHTNPEYRKNEIEYKGLIKTVVQDNTITAELPEALLISRMKINFIPYEGCELPIKSYVQTSVDGINWKTQGDPLPFDQAGGLSKPGDTYYNYFFAAQESKFVKVVVDNNKSCLLNKLNLDFVVFE